jgi:Na+/melibiose symporter-like transporter
MISSPIAWFRKFQSAKPQTKFFIMNWTFYFILMLVTTLWCYARIEYVHQARQQPQQQTENIP